MAGNKKHSIEERVEDWSNHGLQNAKHIHYH
jgi:hypothetical protein